METTIHYWGTAARSLLPRRNHCLLSGEQPESRYFAPSPEAASRPARRCRCAVLLILRSLEFELLRPFSTNFDKFQPTEPFGERCPNSALFAPYARPANARDFDPAPESRGDAVGFQRPGCSGVGRGRASQGAFTNTGSFGRFHDAGQAPGLWALTARSGVE